MKKPQQKTTVAENLVQFVVEAGQVLHYKGLPFYACVGAVLLGSPGNVAAAQAAEKEGE